MVHQKETIDARLLRVFAEVAKRRSVTAAASALGLPKSAVSKAISEIERRAGVRVLERSTRRVGVTPAGEILQSRASSILAELDNLVDDLQDEVRSIRGVVRLTAPPELGALLAQRFVPGLLERHPGLELGVELDYAFADVLDPRLDLGFRIGIVHDDRLVAHRLGAFSRILVAQPGWLARNRVRRPEDLSARNCLVFSAAERQAVWTLRRTDGRGASLERNVPVRGNLAIRGFAALLAAAAAGLGVARVPPFVGAEAIARGELARVLPGWESPPSEVFLVHRFGHDRVRRVEAVIDRARAEVGALLRPAARAS